MKSINKIDSRTLEILNEREMFLISIKSYSYDSKGEVIFHFILEDKLLKLEYNFTLSYEQMKDLHHILQKS